MRCLLGCSSALVLLSCSAADRGPDKPSGERDPVVVLTQLGAFAAPHAATTLRLPMSLPAHAAAPLRLGEGQAWLEVTAEDMLESSHATSPRVGTTVFRDAAPDLDLVYVAEAGRVEELRVARTLAAAGRSSWRLRLGPDLTNVQVVDGRIEVVDAKGVVRFATEPAWAIDARGIKRPLSLSLQGHVVHASLDTSGLVAPVAVDPAWVATSKPSSLARTSFSLTRLLSGKVLLAGGGDNSTGIRVSTCEVYDPTTNTWASTGSLSKPRAEHTATALGGGSKKVVIAGGYTTSTESTMEIYDEATGTFQLPTPLPGAPSGARRGHAAVQLAGGDVLIIGGRNDSSNLDTMIRTDGALVTALPFKLLTPTDEPMAVLLDDGRILVAGGWTPSGPLQKVSKASYLVTLTGPSTGSVAAGPDLPAGRVGAVPAVIDTGANKGKAIFVGGGIASISSESLTVPSQGGVIFDPTLGKWSTLPFMSRARDFSAGTLLGGGKFLISGGSESSAVAGSANGDGEVLDLVTLTWKGAGKMIEPRAAHKVVALADGSVLINGGIRAVLDGVLTMTSGPERFALQAVGAACDTDGQCSSGFCVDGVCCDKACGGQCEACDVTGSVGTCKAATGMPHGKRAACTTVSGGDAACASACNGTDASACKFPDATAVCGVDACTAGKETHAAKCDGAGNCTDVAKACGDYVCDTKACKTSCATKADCSNPSHFCEATKCIPQQANGSPCTRDEACATGMCVDGTCCESKCDGQCQACDVPGQAGKCVGIKGKPHGVRKDCDKDSADACKSKSCDGTNTASCAATVGPCGNYACDDEVKACKKVCVAAIDCGAGFECDATGKCVPRTSKCIGIAEVQAADGSKIKCEGFICSDGRCLDTCTNSNQCQNGFACDSGKCQPTTNAAAPAADSGGCLFGARPTGGAAGFIFAALAVASMRRRRS